MRRFILVFVAAAALLPLAPASAAVRNFPGTCGATLAACIASSPAGTTIRLRTNALVQIPDVLEIDKGLTIEAAPGFKPRIGPTGAEGYMAFSPLGSGADVTIRGVRFENVDVETEFSVGAGTAVVFENNRWIGTARAISVYFQGTARGSVRIVGNDIVASMGMDVSAWGGPVTIARNRISSTAADSESGIMLAARGSGTVRATVENNLVVGATRCNCGANAAVYMKAHETVTLDVRFLGNTIADSGLDPGGHAYGLSLVSASTPDAHLKVALYNNIVANVFDRGIWADDTVELTGDRNNSFGSAMGDNLPPTTSMAPLLHVDPRFVNAAAGDYRLATGSPLANKGRTCIPGLPLARADLGGKFRIAGGTVDLGAYERGSKVSGGVKGVNRSGSTGANTIRGTGGRDVLCGNEGNDKLFGKGGADLLIGGLGKDKAFGGSGDDRLDLRDGKRGNDRADGGPGKDVCLKDARDRRTSC